MTDPADPAASRRALRWNFGAALIDAAGWGVGMGLVSQTTILPLFVRELTHEPLAVGLIPVATYFGWFVPGILVASWIERLPRVRKSVIVIALFERLALVLMAIFAMWLGRSNRLGLLIAFFACWLAMNLAMGLNIPGYYKLIAKTIPADLRGRLYGLGGAASGVLGAAAAPLAAWFLTAFGFPGGFALCFLAACVAQTAGVLPLGWMREPLQPPAEHHRQVGIRESLRVIVEDRRLFWITAAAALYGMNQMSAGYFAVYAQDRFQASPILIAGAFTATAMGAKTVAFVLVGWLGDRRGNRVALERATAAGVAAALAAWISPSLGGMYLVFALNEAAVQGWGVCGMNYVLELCPSHRAGTYTAVYGLFSAPFRILPPIAGGLIAGTWGYCPVFLLASIAGLVGIWVLHRKVPEVRGGPLSQSHS